MIQPASQSTPPEITIPVTQRALVVGSGVSAVLTALQLADRGTAVTLACPADKPLDDLTGAMVGFLAELAAVDAEVPADFDDSLANLARRLEQSDRVDVLTGTAVIRVTGQAGNFRVTLRSEENSIELPAGAVVLAPEPFTPARPEDVGLDTSRRATTLPGLMLNVRKGYIPRSVALLTDAVAQQGRMTTATVFAAARYLAMRGSQRIRIYCKHVRVSSPGLERVYRAARAAGVELCRYDGLPTVGEESDGVALAAHDLELGRVLRGTFDLFVAADLLPATALDDLLAIFRCRKATGRGENVWQLPTETSRPGVFALGAENLNADLEAVRRESALTAGHVADLLVGETWTLPGGAAEVDAETCVACLTCLRLCPHAAIDFDPADQAARIAPVACQRCGLCAAECPAQAITLPGYDDPQLRADFQPGRTVVFACENSAHPAAEAAAEQGLGLPKNTHLVRVPCASQVDPRNVLAAFEAGADRVLVLTCNEDACQYLDGPTRAEKRLVRLKRQLTAAGFDASRLAWGSLIATETHRLIDLLSADGREPNAESTTP